MRTGWNADAMEPNAYHKAEDWNDDDNTSTEVHCDSFGMDLRIDVFQDVKSIDERAQSGHGCVDNHGN